MAREARIRSNNNLRIQMIKNVKHVVDIFEHSANNKDAYNKAHTVLKRMVPDYPSEFSRLYNDLTYICKLGKQGKDIFSQRAEGYIVIEVNSNEQSLDCWTFDSAYGKYLTMDQVELNQYCAAKLRYIYRIMKQL